VFCDPPYRDSFADYNQPFPDIELEKLVKTVEQNDNFWLCNRDSGDGFFDKVQAHVVKIPVTYTAGRRKKTQTGFEAKKAMEVLIFRNLVAAPNSSLFYQESSHG
jgi:DNA adenine methylase